MMKGSEQELITRIFRVLYENNRPDLAEEALAVLSEHPLEPAVLSELEAFLNRLVPYSRFRLKSVRDQFDIQLSHFNMQSTEIPSGGVSQYLKESLIRAIRQPLVSAKARSEAIVYPVLSELQYECQYRFDIYSGTSLNVDVEKGLWGLCDFILTPPRSMDEPDAPIFMIVKVEHEGIEKGLGPCAAQLVGSQSFNQQKGLPNQEVYGCVTTGEVWQFMRLRGKELTQDKQRFYLTDIETIIQMLKRVVNDFSF